jgi:hypothetical protein
MGESATVQNQAPVMKQMYSDKDTAMAKAWAKTMHTKKKKKVHHAIKAG